jgi:hypothetical protein
MLDSTTPATRDIKGASPAGLWVFMLGIRIGLGWAKNHSFHTGSRSHTWILTSLAYFSSSNCSILAFSAL